MWGMNRMGEFDDLETGEIYRFRDWPVSAVPRYAAGVYTVWDEEERFIYVGMAGRGADASTIIRWSKEGLPPKGLWQRLNAHASGRRSGDQFCIYVADRLVLPRLTPAQLIGISEGTERFDSLVRRYIREHLGFRFRRTEDGAGALESERKIRVGALRAGAPSLNPANAE